MLPAKPDSLPAVTSPPFELDQPATEAGRALIRYYRDEMLARAAQLRGAERVTGIHKMRVAVRRMRTVLSLMRRYYHKEERYAFSRRLRQIAQALGPAREFDVMAGHVAGHGLTLPLEKRRDLRFLYVYVERQRERAAEHAVAFLDSTRYTNICADLDRFCETPGSLNRDDGPLDGTTALLRHAFPRMALRAYEDVWGYGPVLKSASLHDLHSLRIRAKRLRYLLEFAASVLPPESAELVEAATAIQDTFGLMQDIRTELPVLAALDRSLRAAHGSGRAHVGGIPVSEGLRGVRGYASARHRMIPVLREEGITLWASVAAPAFRERLIAMVLDTVAE